MKIAVLSSSRADYGIYLPLLKALQNDPFFDVGIIAFGTHLSSLHGHTVDQVKQDGFRIDHEVKHMGTGDSEQDVAESMALAFSAFARLWAREKENYDLVFCLGDRYEMFAAVSAASAYRIRFAHFHGGETTLGAIDNEYRHCLTIFSTLHFVATEEYAARVAAIKGSGENIYTIGSLSLENLEGLNLYSKEEFQEQFQIDLSKPTLLLTYHPETVIGEENRSRARELAKALKEFRDYQVLITMPNADAMGNSMREVYRQLAGEFSNIILVENLGTRGYFTALKWCKLVAGNSSSGIIEAASFGKYVVDIGNRQKGRAVSANIIHAQTDADSIVQAIKKALAKGSYEGSNIYYKPGAARAVIQVLKAWEK